MNPLRVVGIFGTVSVMLILSACYTLTPTPPPESLLVMPAQGEPCAACDQATLASALTQEKNNADNQAASTAEIMRANAQATLNSANATLSAAQTQEQNNADVIAAQIAATAQIVRADAQATLNSAGSTQNAALTQDAIRQTQAANLATTDAQSLLIQQNKNDLAAGTQTAIANNIATQTRAAAATSQWYTDQDRQREEQRKGPIAFFWMLCLPIFILLIVGLVLWGFWRRLKIQQDNQRILETHVERLSEPTIEIVPHRHNDSLPYTESDLLEAGSLPTKPDDQVRGWLEEVKHKLLRRDKEDKDDHPNH